MKKNNSYPILFIILGLMISQIAFHLDGFWVKVTLTSFGILLELLGVLLLLKELRNEKKLGKESTQDKQMSIRINGKKLMFLLMPLFSSMLVIISILVLLLFFSIEKIEMWRIYLIAIAIVWACIGKFDYCVKASGLVRPANSVSTIIPSVSGKIETVNIKEGQIVKKGDVLFTINSDLTSQTHKAYEELLNSNIDEPFIRKNKTF